MVPCLVCKNTFTNIFKVIEDVTFMECKNCHSIFKHPKEFLSPKAEKSRYLLHNNDVEDKQYQQFVSPIISKVIQSFPTSSMGLDFGAGSGPVIKELLVKKGFDIALYDPFFHPNVTVLNQQYDFIVCCEVIEHFHNPENEFKHLKKMLLPKGKLYCMTELIPNHTNFEYWYYIKDPTHVIFYSKENLNWIRENLGFSDIIIEGRLIILSD